MARRVSSMFPKERPIHLKVRSINAGIIASAINSIKISDRINTNNSSHIGISACILSGQSSLNEEDDEAR